MNNRNYLQWLKDASNLGIELEDADVLARLARSSHRLAEVSCNYGLTPRQEKRDANLDKKARAIVEKYGLFLSVQGDPRGWPYFVAETQEAADDHWRAIGIPPY